MTGAEEEFFELLNKGKMNKTITDAVAVIGFQIHDIYLNCKKSPRGVPFLNKKEGLEFARLLKSIDKQARGEERRKMALKLDEITKKARVSGNEVNVLIEIVTYAQQLLQTLKEIK